MSVQTFYNSIKPIGTLAVVLAAVSSPDGNASQFSVLQSANPLTQENPIRLLPNSTIFMTQPPTPSGAARNPRVTDVLGKAFNNDDLNALYGSGSFGNCETSSRVPSIFEKNYSNFVHSCLEEHKSKQAVLFDERFQSDPHTQGVATAPLGGRVQWTKISAGARERLLQRSVNELAQKNKTLADIIQGRISIDFGLGQFWSSSNQHVAHTAPRPRFVVEVDQQPTNIRSLNKRKYVASLGQLPQGSIDGEAGSAHWLSNKPRRAKRILRETFEPAPQIASTLNSQPELNSEENLSSDTVSSMKYLSRLAGLQHIPFTKVNMRAERRVVDGKNQFALRAMESQELAFAEIPDTRNASASTLVWGYKIPWKQHALNVRFDESSQERTTSYSYKVDDSNKTDVSFNHKNNAVSAGFVMTF